MVRGVDSCSKRTRRNRRSLQLKDVVSCKEMQAGDCCDVACDQNVAAAFKRKVPGIGGGERSGDGELSGIRAPDGQVLGEYPVELGIRQSDRAKAVRDAADIDRP